MTENRKSRSRRRQRSEAAPATRVVDDLKIRKAGTLDKFRSFVLYGRSGTGKTTLASSFPGRVLLIDIKDRGTDSVADVEDLDIRDVETWEDFELTYWYLKSADHEYQTVIIDTMTQLQQIAVEDTAAEKKKASGKAAGEWGTLTKQDWGHVASIMKLWIMNFRDLDMNVVFIAQDRSFNTDDEEEGGELTPEIGPRLMPSVRSHLNAAVSVIGNTFIRQRWITKKNRKTKEEEEREITEYCLRIGPSAVYDTKVRKPRGITPPDILVDPTYEEIMELIKGE